MKKISKPVVAQIAAYLLVVVFVIISVTACGNKRVFDMVYTYDYAIIELPDGTIVRGEVEDWTDYSDGDQLQIKMKNDGIIYLVHSSKCTLMKTKGDQ